MSDFTFRDPLTGIIRFNDANVIHIGYEPSSEDITITAQNDETGTSKTITTNMSGGGGGAVLGTKTITENGTYNASADSLDGYSSVTVNVPATGITPDQMAQRSLLTGSISIDTATKVGYYAFNEANITSVTSTSALSIENFAFASCRNLVTVNMPSVTGNLGTHTFENCENIENLNVRNATGSTGYVFTNCSKIRTLALPHYSGATGSRLTRGCSLLEKIDLGFCSRIDAQALDNCPVFNVLVLRKTDTITVLSNVSAFDSTPFAANGAGGVIYAPAALLNDYEIGSNWSMLLASNENVSFSSLEDSIYNTKSVDGLEV